MLLMYLGFYENDRAVLEEAVMESAIYAAANYADDIESIEKNTLEKCKEITNKKLFAMKNVNFNVSRDGNYICVYADGNFLIPMFGSLQKAVWGRNIIISAEGKGVITKPVRNLYVVRGISGIASVDFYKEGKLDEC